jgi:hypothetical protein
MQNKNSRKQLSLMYPAILLSVFFTASCKDRYKEGYDAGYEQGFSQASVVSEKSCDERLEEEKRSCSNKIYPSGYSSEYSTAVCGGGGVNVNGKHYEGGKTGCVRVYNDGRVVRY